MSAVARRTVLVGDATTRLRELPDRSVDCVVTSPPYFLLRDYQIHGQIGLETNVNGWVDHVLGVVDELARVIKPTGSLWLNLGDSYSRHERYGAAAKSLLLGPERLLLKLAARGWIVRNKVVWAKPNPLPASVRDRLTCSWEPIYLLVRSSRYFFDLDAIRVPHRSQRKAQTHPPTRDKYGGRRPAWAGPLAGTNNGLVKNRLLGRAGHPLGKNPGDIWSIAKARYRGAHFATFPVQLLDLPLRATCPKRTCAACGGPWQGRDQSLRPDCECGAGWLPGLVLDPFFGAGTVAIAAEQLRRDWLGIELSPDYVELALERITDARTHRREVMPLTKERSNA